MAFDQNYYGNTFSTMNQKAPTGRCYASSTDALATILGAGYFNDRKRDLKVGTLIYVNASDANALLMVTDVTTDVLTDVLVQGGATSQIIAAGQYLTTGGAAAEDIAITGVLTTDTVSVVLHTAGATPRTVLSAVAAVDKITVTFSGDPSIDHVVNYIVVRSI